MKEFIISIFSGIIGIFLTIGYQHFFAPDPTIIVNVGGEEVEVTSSSYEELSIENESLKKQNDLLYTQNEEYYDELTETKNEIEELQSQTNNTPEINYSNLGLSINTNDIPINKNNSMITIDGREYLSKEIVEKLIPDDQSMTIKDDTLFIGKVVADKANLFDQNILNRSDYLALKDTVKDSYGNTRSNVIMNGYYGSNIIYSLDKEYTYLKCTISMSEDYSVNSITTITIISDEEIIYTSDIDKKTEPYDIEVPINNCKLLTIQFDSESGRNGCIISDAILYN